MLLKTISLILVISFPAVIILSSSFNMFFAVADTFAGYKVFLEHGFSQSVYMYWNNYIGRVSAMAYFFGQIAVLDTIAPSPWTGLVAARIFNHLLIIIAFYFSFRSFIPNSSRSTWLLIAIFSYGVGQSYWGLEKCEGCHVTEAMQVLWLLDYSIYFLSISTFLIVMGLFWRYINNSLNTKCTFLFLLFYVCFLNAHELNLVIGGIILGTMIALSFVPYIFKAFEARRYQAASIIGFSVAYTLSVAVQLLSPSLIHRNTVWPSKLPLFPDAVIGGLSGGWAVFERIFDLSHPAILTVFLVCFLAGIVSYRRDNMPPPTPKWQAFVFISLSVLLLAALAFTASTLMVYKGRMVPGSATLSSMQHVYLTCVSIGVAGYIGMLTAGLFAKTQIKLNTIAMFPLTATLSIWILLPLVTVMVLLTTPSWRDNLSYLQGKRWISAAGMDAPNQTALYARLDQQLRQQDSSGTAYVDEVFLHRGDPDNPTFRLLLEQNGMGLSKMYRIKDLVYIPCELGPRPTVCNGKGKRPDHKSHNFDDRALLAKRWSSSVGVAATQSDRGLLIRETAGQGGRFLQSSPFDKGSQVAIRIKVHIVDSQDVKLFGIYAIDNDSKALQVFDLNSKKVSFQQEFGGRVVHSKIKKLDDNSIVLSSVFTLYGPSPSFMIRLQFVNDEGKTIYTGSKDRSITINKITLYMVNS